MSNFFYYLVSFPFGHLPNSNTILNSHSPQLTSKAIQLPIRIIIITFNFLLDFSYLASIFTPNLNLLLHPTSSHITLTSSKLSLQPPTGSHKSLFDMTILSTRHWLGTLCNCKSSSSPLRFNPLPNRLHLPT